MHVPRALSLPILIHWISRCIGNLRQLICNRRNIKVQQQCRAVDGNGMVWRSIHINVNWIPLVGGGSLYPIHHWWSDGQTQSNDMLWLGVSSKEWYGGYLSERVRRQLFMRLNGHGTDSTDSTVSSVRLCLLLALVRHKRKEVLPVVMLAVVLLVQFLANPIWDDNFLFRQNQTTIGYLTITSL